MVPNSHFRRTLEDIDKSYSNVIINSPDNPERIQTIQNNDLILVAYNPVQYQTVDTWVYARQVFAREADWDQITSFRIFKQNVQDQSSNSKDKEFKVGDKWGTKDGRIVTIESTDTGRVHHPILADLDGNKVLYDLSGRHMYPIEHDLDLIGRMVFMNPRQAVERS